MDKLNYKEMSYPEYCGALYTKKMSKTLKLEADNPATLPQEAFTNNRSRAAAISFEARTYVGNFEALTGLRHREIKHEENHKDESIIVTAELEAEDMEAAAEDTTPRAPATAGVRYVSKRPVM